MLLMHTLCPRSSDPFHIVAYYIKWVTTSLTDSTYNTQAIKFISTTLSSACIAPYVFFSFWQRQVLLQPFDGYICLDDLRQKI